MWRTSSLVADSQPEAPAGPIKRCSSVSSHIVERAQTRYQAALLGPIVNGRVHESGKALLLFQNGRPHPDRAGPPDEANRRSPYAIMEAASGERASADRD